MEQDSLQDIRHSLTDSLERLFVKVESLERRLNELERVCEMKAADSAREIEETEFEGNALSSGRKDAFMGNDPACLSGQTEGGNCPEKVEDCNGADSDACGEEGDVEENAVEEVEESAWNLEMEEAGLPEREKEEMEEMEMEEEEMEEVKTEYAESAENEEDGNEGDGEYEEDGSEEVKVKEEEDAELEQSVEIAVEEAEAVEAAGEWSACQENEDEAPEIVNDDARADWYDWEVDYPASHIDNIYDGIGINDRYEFVRELFNVNGNLHEAELLFKRTIDDLNRLDSFKEALVYIRARFPQWDELSDEVYRFYMTVRRKFS